jgi:hypothetical protein
MAIASYRNLVLPRPLAEGTILNQGFKGVVPSLSDCRRSGKRAKPDGFAPLGLPQSATQSVALAGVSADRVLPRAERARLAVLALTPSLRPISRQETLEARNWATCEVSTSDAGRPMRFPFARAFRNPAFTLSTIRLRSSSATAPKTVKTIFPAGVEVSICSEYETKSIPRA